MTTDDTLPPAVPAGVWCPVISLYKPTPLQELDLVATRTYFRHLISSGVNGLVLQGSTAEAALLLPEERVTLTRLARDVARELGVPDFPLAAGVSGQSTVETFRLIDDAVGAGADFALLLPPSYWPKAIGNKDIVAFYEEVADYSPIPVIIYNVSLCLASFFFFFGLLPFLLIPLSTIHTNLLHLPVPRRDIRHRPKRRRPVPARPAPQHRRSKTNLRQRRQSELPDRTIPALPIRRLLRPVRLAAPLPRSRRRRLRNGDRQRVPARRGRAIRALAGRSGRRG